MAKLPSPLPPPNHQEDARDEEEEGEVHVSSHGALPYSNPCPGPMPHSSPATPFVYHRRVRRRTHLDPRFPTSKKPRAVLGAGGGASSSAGNRGVESTTALVAAFLTPRNRQPRSAELMRATCKSAKDELGCRLSTRRVRITFDSLRFLLLRKGEPGVLRADLKAAEAMCDSGLWLHRDRRIIGPVPGSRIGDVFFYRSELQVVGLHGLCQGGIDYVPASRSSTGEAIVTSIVVSGGYEDDEDHGSELIYTGQGGKPRNRSRLSADQKLTAGNLALQNNERYGMEIRVIRGFNYEGSPSGKVYVYDGLYKVHNHWRDTTKFGFTAYRFRLRRVEGQEPMASAVLKFVQDLKANPSKWRPKGLLSRDISRGAETFAGIPLFNDVDDDSEPLSLEYLIRPRYPRHVLDRSNAIVKCGCRCTSICTSNCDCAKKNGGEFAYDENGFLLRGKPLIYECGSWCRCPSSCPNRVSQRGIRHRLQVFRTKQREWRLRSLDMIRAGAFVCEFSGVVLPNEVIPLDGSSSLIRPSQFPERWSEWGDLSDVFPDHRSPDFPPPPQLSFSMDLSSSRNVAGYIAHSSCPNVFVQHVLYDHQNASYAHLMIFAMENIPPLRELSMDYGVSEGSDGD